LSKEEEKGERAPKRRRKQKPKLNVGSEKKEGKTICQPDESTSIRGL